MAKTSISVGGIAKVVAALFLAIALLQSLYVLAVQTQAYSEGVISSAISVRIAPPWDTIDDGVKECVLNALRTAESRNEALILEINSYGGLLEAGFAIGDAFTSSRVPVIAYVYSGNAFSAATLIMLPTNVIAVSPNAVIGDMQPVEYNPITGQVTFINASKIVNAVVTKAVSYAKLRGRNITLVEEFVRNAKAVTADKAVRWHVADLMATDMNDLLSKLKGLKVRTAAGNYTLEITDVTPYPCSIRSRMISAFENPIVSSIMMTIGVLGTLFALLSGKLPVLPLALLFLLLGILGSGFSPNLMAIAFLTLGAILLFVELFITPGFGILGVSGITLIALGIALSPVAIPVGTSPPPGYVGSLRTIALTIGGFLGAFTGFVLYKIIEAKRSRPKPFTPVGVVGIAIDEITPDKPGFIKVSGEYWKAVSDEVIKPGDRVRVLSLEGTHLRVKRLGEEDSSKPG